MGPGPDCGHGLPRRSSGLGRGLRLTRAQRSPNESIQFVKVFGWYDNEWGFSCRLVDVVARPHAGNNS
jgi:hypothetical protein